MHKVKRMTASPVACLLCGRGNVPDHPDTMDEFWAADLERDIDWGDAAYLCKYCCDRIGVFAGLVGMQEYEEQVKMVQAQAKRIHDLEAKLTARDRRLRQVDTGEAARRRVEKERKAEEVRELRKRARSRGTEGKKKTTKAASS